jgi:hypothetical protein
MESENILAVNIPNMVSITIMAVLGAFILGLARKWYMQSQGQN